MNHKWDENNKCVRCGLEREMKTWKVRMAIIGSKDYYQYGREYAYSFNLKKWSFKRPECKK